MTAARHTTVKAVTDRRWRWAQEGQRRAQTNKRKLVSGQEKRIVEGCTQKSERVAHLLLRHGFAGKPTDVVVEIGSGAHGLIWRWRQGRRYGVDPLATFYRQHFAFLQEGPVESVEACGEHLPFEDAAADVLLSDNVLDHVRDPEAVLREARRVVRPDGVLYLTFDTHHPLWDVAARLYNRLCDVGLKLRLPGFPNHPFHFQEAAVDSLLERTGWSVTWRRRDKASPRLRRPRDLVKLAFYKDLRVSLLARPADVV